jgi:hypothetical protein
MSDGNNVSIRNNQLTINTFKPKVVEMYMREHLEKFREAAEATGMGLGWHNWRFTVQVGSNHWRRLVAAGAMAETNLHGMRYRV